MIPVLADLPPGDSVDLELPAGAGSVRTARKSVGDYAAEVGAERFDVELAVSEAVSNAVVHAYPEGGAGTIRVRARAVGDSLEITVSDDGTGLRPNLNSPGLGLGIPLIAKLSEAYRLEDGPGGGAMVSMSFSTAPA